MWYILFKTRYGEDDMWSPWDMRAGFATEAEAIKARNRMYVEVLNHNGWMRSRIVTGAMLASIGTNVTKIDIANDAGARA